MHKPIGGRSHLAFFTIKDKLKIAVGRI
jgi:hypothetical protein